MGKGINYRGRNSHCPGDIPELRKHHSTVYPIRSLSTGSCRQFSFPNPLYYVVAVVYEVMALFLSNLRALCSHLSISCHPPHTRAIDEAVLSRQSLCKQLPLAFMWWKHWKTKKCPRLISECNCFIYSLASRSFRNK